MNTTPFKIIVAGKSLVLSKDYRLRMVLRSPLFHEIGESSYSLPFDLPAAPNAALLNYPDRYGIPEEAFECELLLYGNHFKKGKLYLESINENTIQAYLKIDSIFPEELLEKKINRMDVLPTLDFDSETDLIDHMEAQIPGDGDHVFFPLHNDKVRDHLQKLLASMQNLSVTPILNYRSAGAFKRIRSRMKYVHPIYNTESMINRTDLLISPYIFLSKYLEQLFTKHAFPLSNDFSGTGYDQLVIYNNVLADTGMYRNWEDIKPKLRLNHHLPEISLEDFLNQLNDFLSASFFLDDNRVHCVFWEDVLRDLSYTDLSDKLIQTQSLTPKAKDEKLYTFNYTSPSGDQSWDLIQELSTANLKGKKSTFSQLPSNPVFADVYYVEEDHLYWTYEAISEDGANSEQWNIYSVNLFGIPHGNTELDFDHSFEVTPVFAYRHEIYVVFYQSEEIQGVASYEFNIPTAHQELSSYRFNSSETTEELRLLIYHGLVNNSPYASHHNVNPSGATSCPFSLDINSKDSLFYKNRQNWNDFLNHSMESELELQLSWATLQDIDFKKRYRIDGIDFLFKQLEFDISEMGISPTEAIVQQVSGNTIKNPPLTDTYTFSNSSSNNSNSNT